MPKGFKTSNTDLLLNRAKDGVGLIIPGAVMVYSTIGRKFLGDSPSAFKGVKEFMDELHSYGTKLFVQLAAGMGRNFPVPMVLYKARGVMNVFSGFDKTTASSDAGLPNRWIEDYKTKEMTVKDIKRVLKGFADAAYLCQQNGIDGVDVHALHEGYLMDQFAMNRYTRSFINQIMADYERQTDEERERARTEIEISMLEGDHGVQGWEVGASYDTVWDVLLRMLPEYGFKISESEKIRGSIIVSYDEPSASFWREKGIDPFAIDEDDYRIEVGLADGKTTIQFFDDDNVRLQPDTVERLYFRFANALAESFRQVTSKAVRVSGR